MTLGAREIVAICAQLEDVARGGGSTAVELRLLTALRPSVIRAIEALERWESLMFEQADDSARQAS